MAPKHLVIDGSNIATEGRSMPSLAQLDEAVQAFLKERPHDTYTVVVDATFGHRIDASEKAIYEEALAANEMVTPPAGTIGRGDKFLLEIADRANATVFSNDSFQEFHGEYEWLFDAGRLVGGKPVPQVGWIFTERTPVRGPKSRMASRAAGERRGRLSATSGRSRRSPLSSLPVPVPTVPPPRRRLSAVRATPPEAEAPAEPQPETPAPEVAAATGSGEPRRRRRSPSSPEPVNPPLAFIEFIAEHVPGSTVEGEVLSFTSHGAFVQVGDVRCYLALKYMGDPAPRSARDVLSRGEVRTFVVQALDAPRRGIDLALPGCEDLSDGAPSATVAEAPSVAPARSGRGRRRAAAMAANDDGRQDAPGSGGRPDGGDEGSEAEPEEPAATPARRPRRRRGKPEPDAVEPTPVPVPVEQASPGEAPPAAGTPRRRRRRLGEGIPPQPAPEAPMPDAALPSAAPAATRRRRARPAAVDPGPEPTEAVAGDRLGELVPRGEGSGEEQSPAAAPVARQPRTRRLRRVAPEGTPAEAAAAVEAPARPGSATRVRATGAPAATAAAGEASASEAPAPEPAAKAPATKASATKASAKKAAATKAPAKKAPAKKAPATKASATKASATKAPAKKAPAKKAPAKKAPAKKAPATKAPAKKAPATKAAAKKAPARRPVAGKDVAPVDQPAAAPGRKAPGRKAAARKAPARATTATEATDG